MTLVEFWVKLQKQNPEYAEKMKNDYQGIFIFLLKKRSETDALIAKNLPNKKIQQTASAYDYQQKSEPAETELTKFKDHSTYLI